MKGESQCEGATLSEPGREGWGLSALRDKGLQQSAPGLFMKVAYRKEEYLKLMLQASLA